MTCPICQTLMTSFEDSKRQQRYYSCAVCECIAKDSASHLDFTAQEERYNLHNNDENSQGYQAYFQRFIDFFIDDIQGSSALDFGCGKSTLLAQMLEKAHYSCDYYDPIYHPTPIKENSSYDLILSSEVFEHLHKPLEVFAFLLSKLKIGGHLAIQTAFHPRNIQAFKKWYYPHDPTHIVFFTASTFEYLSAQYGCEVVKCNDKNMVLMRKMV